jgi:hypothetical protein
MLISLVLSIVLNSRISYNIDMDIDISPGLQDLFAQLGLPNDQASILKFIKEHALPKNHPISLADAPWWTASQAEFLRNAIAEDAQWAEQVDELNAILQEQGI